MFRATVLAKRFYWKTSGNALRGKFYKFQSKMVSWISLLFSPDHLGCFIRRIIHGRLSISIGLRMEKSSENPKFSKHSAQIVTGWNIRAGRWSQVSLNWWIVSNENCWDSQMLDTEVSAWNLSRKTVMIEPWIWIIGPLITFKQFSDIFSASLHQADGNVPSSESNGIR